MAKLNCIIEEAIGETRVALNQGTTTVELIIERWSERDIPKPGDIFSGRVKIVDPRIMAAFIDLGVGPHGMIRFTMASAKHKFVEGEMVRVRILRACEPGKGPLLEFKEPSDAATPICEQSNDLRGRLLKRFPHIVFRTGIVGGFEEACEPILALKNGGNIAIEHTRAGAMIDVDSDGYDKTKVSVEAAKTIARQFRLRGIGGMILIDFPNIRNKKGQSDVWQTLKDHFANDPANVKLAPFSRFGTVEMTRQKYGLSLAQRLLRADGELSDETLALGALRMLVKEAKGTGNRLVMEVPDRAKTWLENTAIGWELALNDAIGARYSIKRGEKIEIYKDEV